MTEFEQLSNGNGNTYNSIAVNMVFQGPSTGNTYNKVAVNPVLQGQCISALTNSNMNLL